MLAESQSIDQVVLPSREDASANIIAPYAEGYSEARYVRRCRDYFIAYISSQAGCRQACRFCHLTATGQTSDTDIDIEHQISQLGQILKIYHDRVASGLEPAADYFNINWMARGEPLASRELARNWIGMANEMRLMAAFEGLPVNFNISTIWPKDLALDPRHVDLGSDVTLFYSLYSLDDAWRRRWLPRAADWRQALDHLAEWQVAHAGKIVLHWALIAGENDDPGMADKIGREVESRGARRQIQSGQIQSRSRQKPRHRDQ